MSLVLDTHRVLVADQRRVGAYARALAEVVRPGDIVADLGAGTGILGMLACRAGAARVYAVEETSLVQLLREIVSANAFAGRIIPVRGRSTQIRPPELVDLAVGDQLGGFGFDAGVVGDFADARRRWLKPGGRLVPSGIELWTAPVEAPAAWQSLAFWRGAPHGFDYSAAARVAGNTGYPWRFEAGDLLAPPVAGAAVDLSRDTHEPWLLEHGFTVARHGTLHGVAGWFVARLSPHETMTNSPLAEDRIDRRQVFLPARAPAAVRPGDRVRVVVRVRPEDTLVAWRLTIEGREQDDRWQSTFEGMLVDPVELARTRLLHRPALTARGRARQTVLDLVDGRHTVAEIERETHRRHAELFASPEEAAIFVAEVTTRYAE